MDLTSWLLFVPACFALNVYPGPNNLVALANGARSGAGFATVVALARLPAFLGLILLTAVGLGALLAASATWFLVLKIVGAAYLIFIGVRMILADPGTWLAQGPGPGQMGPALRQEFLVAASNPKAIAIFTAFFPQFLVPDAGSFEQQILLMGAAFLVLEALAALVYAVAGRWIGRLASSPQRLSWVSRGSGGALVVSGVLLGLTRAPASAV